MAFLYGFRYPSIYLPKNWFLRIVNSQQLLAEGVFPLVGKIN
ncbi:hypothetical protein SPLC1_S204570 [Arthrospira platensis C1]|nr:hypothetical protein SPLC1_S204570 [Arthrospira platensis C1]